MWIKTNNGIKLIPLLLGLCALTSLPPPLVYASEIPPVNITSTEDELLAAAASLEPAVFSVTVPTSLPIYADGYGNITVATNAAIVNNGNSSVKVTNLGIAQTGPFNIADFDEDFRYKYLDAFEFAMNINGSKTQSNGSINFDASGFPAIPAGSSQLLNYSAKVTGTSTDMEDVHVTDVCLTLDWNAPVTITYDARGGTFADGTSVNTVTYTQEGKVVSGSMADPTKPNCEFAGWYTDTSFSQQFTGSTTSTTVYARYRVPYTIEYAWQSLDNSHTYLLHESQSLMGLENEVVWPEVRTYDQYKNPRQQSFTVVENGVFRYNYDRTTYWLDVNYIANGTYTGGPDDWSTWPSGLSSNFLSVYINGAYSGGGRDYCKTQPFESYYEIVLDLPEDFYYLGTFNEGVDKWNNGTVLYRKPDNGIITENVGMRLIINSLTDSTARYYITFDPNGGEGSMNQMTMAFESGGSEIDWLNKNAFSREGYTFGGWMTTPDGDTAEYQNEQKVSGLSSTNGETITLYALWIPNNPFALENEEEATEGEEIDEEMSEEEEEVDEEAPDDEESPDKEETPSEEGTPGEEETPSEEGVDGEPPVDPELPLDTEPTQPGEDSTNQEEPPDDSDTTPDSPPDTPTTEPGDETTPDVDDETTTPDVDDENESDDTPQETPADTPEDDNLTDEDVENPDDESNISPPSPDSDETPVIPDESTLPDEGNSENPDEPSDDIPDDETDGQVPDNSDSEDADTKNEDDIMDDPENSDETESEETESEETESEEEESEESEEDSEQEDPVVEPTYYCGFDKHVHGEDCPGATCDTIEHEHDASCLIPAPPVENVDPEPEIPEEGTQDSEETQEPLEEPSDDESSNQEVVEEPPNAPVEETLPPKEEVIETKPAMDSETEEPPAENDETATPVEEEITEEPAAE